MLTRTLVLAKPNGSNEVFHVDHSFPYQRCMIISILALFTDCFRTGLILPTRSLLDHGRDRYVQTCACQLTVQRKLACQQWLQSDSNSFPQVQRLGLGVTVTVMVKVSRVSCCLYTRSEFRRHLPKLSAVLLASRRTIVRISTMAMIQCPPFYTVEDREKWHHMTPRMSGCFDMIIFVDLLV